MTQNRDYIIKAHDGAPGFLSVVFLAGAVPEALCATKSSRGAAEMKISGCLFVFLQDQLNGANLRLPKCSPYHGTVAKMAYVKPAGRKETCPPHNRTPAL